MGVPLIYCSYSVAKDGDKANTLRTSLLRSKDDSKVQCYYGVITNRKIRDSVFSYRELSKDEANRYDIRNN